MFLVNTQGSVWVQKGKNTTPMVKNRYFAVIIIDKVPKVISGQSYNMLLPSEDPDISKALG